MPRLSKAEAARKQFAVAEAIVCPLGGLDGGFSFESPRIPRAQSAARGVAAAYAAAPSPKGVRGIRLSRAVAASSKAAALFACSVARVPNRREEVRVPLFVVAAVAVAAVSSSSRSKAARARAPRPSLPCDPSPSSLLAFRASVAASF